MSGTDGPASARAVEHLRSRILSGELEPGARIRQDEIAAELGSSRLPVREALQVLRHQGLVSLRPNAGARVMAYDRAECDLIYRIRERAEPVILEAGVAGLSEEALAEMESIQERIEEHPDVETFLVLDRAFHRISYSGCAMESMLELVDRFWDTTQHYRRTYSTLTNEDGWWAVETEHRMLLAALRDRNAELAGHVLEGHIRRSRLLLAAHPEVFPGPDGQS